MKRFHSRLVLVSLVAALGCGEKHAAEHPHWSYTGDEGPAHWGELEGYSTCADGKSQSPIDIASAAAVKEDLPDLTFDYGDTPLDIVNNGHSIQVNVAPGRKLMIGGDTYDLAQFHFHGPSEHTIDGQHAAMEMHLVHKNAAGDLAVVGVMIRPGAEQSTLATAWAHLPTETDGTATPAGVTVDVASLLPENRQYYHYMGSLTTPPCTEGVHWYVLAAGIEASAEQIGAFGKVIAANNRPLQPLNARAVRLDSTN